jgi:acyl carrier protein
MKMEQLIQTLKEQLIEALNLEETKPEDIGDDMPLFGDGLGLDSIDALEIIILLEKKYGVKLANSADAKPVFYSVRTLAEYIEKNRKR